jgi:hypothetical protein
MTDPEDVKDVTATTLRMSAALHHALAREAHANRRSVNAEAVARIEASLGHSRTPSRIIPSALLAAEPGAAGAEALLLQLWRAMPADKQLALLTVLR